MTKELAIPPFVDIALADLIKKCLNRDVNSRYSIAEVLSHPFFNTQRSLKQLPSGLGGKLGLLAAQRAKRTSSQSSQRSGLSVGSMITSRRYDNLRRKITGQKTRQGGQYLPVAVERPEQAFNDRRREA